MRREMLDRRAFLKVLGGMGAGGMLTSVVPHTWAVSSEFPVQPIEILCPTPAGNAGLLISRTVAELAQPHFGVPLSSA